MSYHFSNNHDPTTTNIHRNGVKPNRSDLLHIKRRFYEVATFNLPKKRKKKKKQQANKHQITNKRRRKYPSDWQIRHTHTSSVYIHIRTSTKLQMEPSYFG